MMNSRRTRAERCSWPFSAVLPGEVPAFLSVFRTGRDGHGGSSPGMQNDLYPDRPDLLVCAREVTHVWWVGTNCSKRDVAAILEIASEVTGLTFGRDL